MSEAYTVYGGAGTGSVTVEATLTLLGLPYRLVELDPSDTEADAEAMEKINPQRQAPALITPAGELMTESAAIIIWLTESHPGLAPPPADPARPAFLRWMTYIAAQIYALYWVRDKPMRLAADESQVPVIDRRTGERILDCWRMMDAQVAPGRFLLGDELSALDIYAAVVSRWGPRRAAVARVAPNLAEVFARVDAERRLQGFWAERFPFVDGWDVREGW